VSCATATSASAHGGAKLALAKQHDVWALGLNDGHKQQKYERFALLHLLRNRRDDSRPERSACS